MDALASACGASVASTSQHLQHLWRAGLVTREKAGLFVTYRLASDDVAELARTLRRVARAHLAEVDRAARAFLDHGVGIKALEAYESELLPATSQMVLRNRGQGPDAVMQWVEDRCGGVFDDLHDVVSHEELAEHAAKYKGVAGLTVEQLNAADPIIPPEHRRIG